MLSVLHFGKTLARTLHQSRLPNDCRLREHGQSGVFYWKSLETFSDTYMVLTTLPPFPLPHRIARLQAVCRNLSPVT
jgi:hypothetical protein